MAWICEIGQVGRSPELSRTVSDFGPNGGVAWAMEEVVAQNKLVTVERNTPMSGILFVF